MASQVRELCESSAGELAELIRRREVSSREVVTAHLERIDELNGELGALTRVLREQALAAADRCDHTEACAPLHGVPFSVKENVDCLGSATTHGLPALREALPYADAPMVERLKGAGAIPIARTNLSELGLRLCTVNPLHGRTLNPYDRRLTAGGSSGGDAVAVATGMVPLGLGNDLGGSLRVPAHANGVCTLKPTTGRIAQASSLPPYDYGPSTQLMLAPGPLARSVSDLRLALAILAGRDRRDPRSVDAPLSGPAPESWRAALVTELPGASLPASSVLAIRRAGDALRAAGWDVEEAQPPELARVNEVFEGLLAADLLVIARQMQPFISEALFAHLGRVCRAAARVELSSYQLYVERSRLQRAWAIFFATTRC
jgi:amidase